LITPLTFLTTIWALLIGDCVHNLRCALDYIAWQLAGSDPDDSQTQFPIFITEAGWNIRADRRVRRMLPAAQAILKKGQPFNGSDPTGTALHGIRLLDDADKHKLLTVIAAMPLQFSVTWVTPTTTDSAMKPPLVTVLPNPTLRGDAVIATIVVYEPGGEEMKMEPYLTPDIAFGERLFGFPPTRVLSSLVGMLAEVKTVIDTFESRPELFK
jgi:hypothetical protein